MIVSPAMGDGRAVYGGGSSTAKSSAASHGCCASAGEVTDAEKVGGGLVADCTDPVELACAPLAPVTFGVDAFERNGFMDDELNVAIPGVSLRR
jgi:hypothetical protein